MTPRERFVELALGAVGLGVGPGRDRDRYLGLVCSIACIGGVASFEGFPPRDAYASISACGLLVRGLLLEAGLRHPLLNPLPAPQPEGAGVAMLRELAALVHMYWDRSPDDPHDLGRFAPKPGDLIFSDPKKPHVAVALPPPAGAVLAAGKVRLWTLDGGQREGHPLGPQWAQRIYREWTFDNERRCWRSIGGELIAWVDFDALAAACGVTS